MGPHPFIIKRFGFITTKKRFGVGNEVRMDEWILNHDNITDVGDEDVREMMNMALKEFVVDQVAKNIWIESRIMLDTHEGNGFVLKPFARLFREIVVKCDSLQTGISD
jgi:hypothetical protein